LILDSLAHRYGRLPSEILTNATTKDLWVFDVASSYHNLQAAKQSDPLAGQDLDELAGKLKEMRSGKGDGKT
jgi:hypothetical protein